MESLVTVNSFEILENVFLTPQKVIPTPKGKIYHALKNSDKDFHSFGEAYFSEVHFLEVKAWKKHQKMNSNILVPIGKIKFVLLDDRPESSTYQMMSEVILGPENYMRLTIPPGLWMGFQGKKDSTNLLLNLAHIEHDPGEALNKEMEEIHYPWDK